MTYKECWEKVSDIRWLMYIIKNTPDLKAEESLSTALRRFALIAAEEIFNLTGEEGELFRAAHGIVSEDIVTGNMHAVIEKRRRTYLRIARNEPMTVKNALEYRSYLLLMDNCDYTAAYKIYENALSVVRTLAGRNSEVTNFFRLRLADEFRELTKGFEVSENMNCERADVITEMDKHDIFPLNGGFYEVYPDNGNMREMDAEKYSKMWETEKSMSWKAYLLLTSGKNDERTLREFAFEKLIKIIKDSNYTSLINLFGDELRIIKETTDGLRDRNETAATAYKDNVLPFMGFCLFKRMIYAAINSLKYENTKDAVMNAFTFMEIALDGHAAGDKEKIMAEITESMRKKFGNPYEEKDFCVPVEYAGLEMLRRNGYAPFVRRGKWGYRRKKWEDG